MPRTISAPALATLLAAEHWHWLRVTLENPDGVLTNVSLLQGEDWLNYASVDDDIDKAVMGATVKLRLDTNSTSFAPAMGGSLINRDAGANYKPFLRPYIEANIEVAVTAIGVNPIEADWHSLGRFSVDEVDVASEENAEVTLILRDIGARLLDRHSTEEKIYGDPAGLALHTVLQDQLLEGNLGDPPNVDYWEPDGTLGPFDAKHAVVFRAPTPPGAAVFEWIVPADTSLGEAMRERAQQIGWELRYRHDPADDAFVLMLYEPERDRPMIVVGPPFAPGDEPDWTINADQYDRLTRLEIKLEHIRNYVEIEYPNRASGMRERVVAYDAASIEKYGLRWMEIIEPDDSIIDSESEAQALADAAVSDLAEPFAEAELEMHLFWPVQLGDVLDVEANDVHFDSRQRFAVVGISHELASGHGTTRLLLRGKVTGAFKEWFRRESPPIGAELPELHDVGVSWDGGDLEYYLWALALPWVTPDANVEFQIREVGGEYVTVATMSQADAYNFGYRIPEAEVSDYDSMRARLVHTSADYRPGPWLVQDFSLPLGGGFYPGPPPVFSFGDYGTSGDAATLNGQPGSWYLDLANHTGTLADARLSSNVALRNVDNFFSTNQTIQKTGLAIDAYWEIRGDAGRYRAILARTGSLARFLFGANSTAETGSDAGSDFAILRYNDAGTGGTTAFTVTRATGLVTAWSGLRVTGGLMGLGNTQSNVHFNMTGTLTSGSGTAQYGIAIQTTPGSDATTSYAGLYTSARSAVAAYTVANLYGIMVATPTIGAGSTATATHGVYVASQTGGGTTYGIRVGAQPTGTTNYSIYTEAGQVRFGDIVRHESQMGFRFGANDRGDFGYITFHDSLGWSNNLRYAGTGDPTAAANWTYIRAAGANNIAGGLLWMRGNSAETGVELNFFTAPTSTGAGAVPASLTSRFRVRGDGSVSMPGTVTTGQLAVGGTLNVNNAMNVSTTVLPSDDTSDSSILVTRARGLASQRVALLDAQEATDPEPLTLVYETATGFQWLSISASHTHNLNSLTGILGVSKGGTGVSAVSEGAILVGGAGGGGTALVEWLPTAQREVLIADATLYPEYRLLTTADLPAGIAYLATAQNWSAVQTFQPTTTNFGTTTNAGVYLQLFSAAGNFRGIRWYTASTVRWELRVNNATESGSDVGSDFEIYAFNDAGAAIERAVWIQRIPTGSVVFGRDILQFGRGTTGAQAYLYLNAPAGTTRALAFRSGSTNRWIQHVSSTAESGSDAGSNMLWNAYTDAGVFIDTPFEITRAATGRITMRRSVTLNPGTMGIGGNSSANVGIFFQGTQNAVSTQNYGIYMVQTLTATANSQTQAAIRLLPTFTPGAFTGLGHYGLLIGDITGGATNYAIFTNAGDVRFGGAVTAASTLAVTGTTTTAQLAVGGTLNVNNAMNVSTSVLPSGDTSDSALLVTRARGLGSQRVGLVDAQEATDPEPLVLSYTTAGGIVWTDFSSSHTHTLNSLGGILGVSKGGTGVSAVSEGAVLVGGAGGGGTALVEWTPTAGRQVWISDTISPFYPEYRALETADLPAGIAYTGTANTFTANQTVSANLIFSGASRTITGLSGVTATTFTGALSGNATTATTLQTTRTIWGQNFNGSANVTGAMSGVTTFGASGLLTLSGGGTVISLTNATSKWIEFSGAGAAVPAFTTRSVGTKIVLYPNLSGTTVDYAIGIAASTVWFSAPQNDPSYFFRWYFGTTERLTFRGDGLMTLAGHFQPSADNTYALGTASLRYANIHAVSLTTYGVTGVILTATGKLYFDGGSDTYMYQSSDNVVDLHMASSVRHVRFSPFDSASGIADFSSGNSYIGFSRISDGSANVGGIGSYNDAGGVHHLWIGAYGDVVIGARSAATFMGGSNTQRLRIGVDYVMAYATFRPNTSATHDLGLTTDRWRHLWMTGNVTAANFIFA